MKKSIMLCLLAAGIIACLVAQDITGTIEGNVLDASGAGVPSAKVTITNADRNQVVRTSTTDSSGHYSAPLIPVGTYAIKVEAAGFKTENRRGVVLNVNDDLKINLSLEVGSLTDRKSTRLNSSHRC